MAAEVLVVDTAMTSKLFSVATPDMLNEVATAADVVAFCPL